MHTPDVKNKKLLFRKSFIMNKFPEFYEEIMKMYPDTEFYNEKLYRYLHNLQESPICPVCGKKIPYRNSPAGYGKFCGEKCMGLSDERRLLITQSKLERYGDPNYNNPEKIKQTQIKKYGGVGSSSPIISKKIKETCKEKFGVENVFKLDEFQEKAKNQKIKTYGNPYYSNLEKRKETCRKRYGVENPMQNNEIHEKFKQSMQEKYGVDYAMQNPDLVKKLSDSLKLTHKNGKYNETHRKNNTFNSSKIESLFIDYLKSNRINFIYQYRSGQYPFDCDFYIPEYDLYIEINGHWTHGGHAFTGSNEDINKVEFWKEKNTKFYNHAIYVWTDLDVRKRKFAKENKLNFLEIFSIDINKCILQFEDKINKMKNANGNTK